jgi:hypothetical protein
MLSRGRRIGLTCPHLGVDTTRSWAPPVIRPMLGLLRAYEYLECS